MRFLSPRLILINIGLVIIGAALAVTLVFTFNLGPADWGRCRAARRSAAGWEGVHEEGGP